MSLYDAVFWEEKKRSFLSNRLTTGGFAIYRLTPTSGALREFFVEEGHRAVALITDRPERVVEGPFRIPGVLLVVGIVDEENPVLAELDYHFTPEEAEGRCPSWKLSRFLNMLRKMSEYAKVVFPEGDSVLDEVFESVPLGKRERSVLETILSAGKVGVTSGELMRRFDMTRVNVRVIIHVIRKKIEAAGYTIVSEGGRYKLVPLQEIQRSA